MKSIITIVLVASAAFLFLMRPNEPFQESARDLAYHSQMPTSDPVVSETLRDSEWTRIRRIDRLSGSLTPMNNPVLPIPINYEQGITPYGTRYQRLVPVSTAEALHVALQDAVPGDFILLADGVYSGNFESYASGTASAPITLYGRRTAIIDGGNLKSGYGFSLKHHYWTLAGFGVRNVLKGVVLDGVSNSVLRSLEIYQVGQEAIHFRSGSQDNVLQHSWVHDVGLEQPDFGEAVYVGSAVANWGEYSGGQPDTSDRNQIMNNLLGPNISAEMVDVKEGTTGTIVRENIFISTQSMVVDSWVDVKGNNATVADNVGMYTNNSGFERTVDIVDIVEGWGNDNVVNGNTAIVDAQPVTANAPFRATVAGTAGVSIGLTSRSLPYSLSEVIVRFPDSFQFVDARTMLLLEHIVVTEGAKLTIVPNDLRKIRLLSQPNNFVSIVGYRSEITIEGDSTQTIAFESWNPLTQAPHKDIAGGRAYVLMSGGRMDIAYATFSDLGFDDGIVSGVAWKSNRSSLPVQVSSGNVYYSQFVRNYFGAYTFEATYMHWQGNTFANNLSYGFDPHDFSNNFLFEDNTAYSNGNHGIIFSRGCENNIIRNNQSFDNEGHGIMLDDGRVSPLDPMSRYRLPVPSNNNIVENNRVWNNTDGIVLEGGVGNIIQNNTLDGVHRYGIRLKDNVSNTQVLNNTIKGTSNYALFVYNGSHTNVIVQNMVSGGRAGISVENPLNEIIRDNTILDVAGSGIILNGDIKNIEIDSNKIVGRGLRVFRMLPKYADLAKSYETQNDIWGWKTPLPIAKLGRDGSLVVWFFVFVLPLFITIVFKTRNGLRSALYGVTRRFLRLPSS